jgi:hypothetical protein
MPAVTATPPPSVPMTFLAAAGMGLTAFGAAAVAVAGRAAAAPTAPTVVAAVHLCMLAFLGTAILGALHQFCPVVGGRRLRSVPAARVTAALWIPGVAALPFGFATDHPLVVSLGGTGVLTALAVAAWNLSGPLSTRGRGAPVTGLRWAVGFFVTTALFGVVYAVDRQAGWFPLMPYRVLAHAHLGLLGGLGLTYVAVAEKLWPMFLLAHPPGRSPGSLAVRLIPAGVGVLVPGLLFAVAPLAVAGGVLVAGGLACHLASLAAFVRYRRRKLELLHAFVLAGAALLVVAAVLGGLAGLAPVSTVWRARLVSGEVVALAGWLGLAVVGHAHKIVPFVGYTALRARGIDRAPAGGPLLFGHLFVQWAARAALAGTGGGFAALVAGTLAASPPLLRLGGVLLAATGLAATANLAAGPVRMLRRAAARPPAGALVPEGGAV